MSMVDKILALGQALRGHSTDLSDRPDVLQYRTTPAAVPTHIPEYNLQPNGLRAIKPDDTSVDVLMVFYVTQMVNKVAEDSEFVSLDKSVQMHQLRYQGHVNDATADTIVGYCLDAGWDEEVVRLVRGEETFVLFLSGPRTIQQIEMDPASMLIALEMTGRRGVPYFALNQRGAETPLVGIMSTFQ